MFLDRESIFISYNIYVKFAFLDYIILLNIFGVQKYLYLK